MKLKDFEDENRKLKQVDWVPDTGCSKMCCQKNGKAGDRKSLLDN